MAFGMDWQPAWQWGELCIFHRAQHIRQDGGKAAKSGGYKMLLSKRVLSINGNQNISQRLRIRFVPASNLEAGGRNWKLTGQRCRFKKLQICFRRAVPFG
jgi:hypothetical protein